MNLILLGFLTYFLFLYLFSKIDESSDKVRGYLIFVLYSIILYSSLFASFYYLMEESGIINFYYSLNISALSQHLKL